MTFPTGVGSVAALRTALLGTLVGCRQCAASTNRSPAQCSRPAPVFPLFDVRAPQALLIARLAARAQRRQAQQAARTSTTEATSAPLVLIPEPSASCNASASTATPDALPPTELSFSVAAEPRTADESDNRMITRQIGADSCSHAGHDSAPAFVVAKLQQLHVPSVDVVRQSQPPTVIHSRARIPYFPLGAHRSARFHCCGDALKCKASRIALLHRSCHRHRSFGLRRCRCQGGARQRGRGRHVLDRRRGGECCGG